MVEFYYLVKSDLSYDALFFDSGIVLDEEHQRDRIKQLKLQKNKTLYKGKSGQYVPGIAKFQNLKEFNIDLWEALMQ